MRILLAATALAFGAHHASADFTMDMTERELRAANGIRTLDDMAVGETANVDFLQLCTTDGGLFAIDFAWLEHAPSNSVAISVKRETDDALSVLIEPALSGSGASSERKQEIYRQNVRSMMMTGGRSCEDLNIGPEESLRILTINGFKKASDLLSSVKEQ